MIPGSSIVSASSAKPSSRARSSRSTRSSAPVVPNGVGELRDHTGEPWDAGEHHPNETTASKGTPARLNPNETTRRLPQAISEVGTRGRHARANPAAATHLTRVTMRVSERCRQMQRPARFVRCLPELGYDPVVIDQPWYSAGLAGRLSNEASRPSRMVERKPGGKLYARTRTRRGGSLQPARGTRGSSEAVSSRRTAWCGGVPKGEVAAPHKTFKAQREASRPRLPSSPPPGTAARSAYRRESAPRNARRWLRPKCTSE